MMKHLTIDQVRSKGLNNCGGRGGGAKWSKKVVHRIVSQKTDRLRCNENVKRTVVSKTITLHLHHHAFWYRISLPSLYANCQGNLLISRLKEDVNIRQPIFHSLFKLGTRQLEFDCRRISYPVSLERTYLCGFQQRANTI